jgi:hypothetical protein
MDNKHRVLLVTGGGSGIGLACAIAYLKKSSQKRFYLNYCNLYALKMKNVTRLIMMHIKKVYLIIYYKNSLRILKNIIFCQNKNI